MKLIYHVTHSFYLPQTILFLKIPDDDNLFFVEILGFNSKMYAATKWLSKLILNFIYPTSKILFRKLEQLTRKTVNEEEHLRLF